MIDTKKDESLQAVLEYLEDESKLMAGGQQWSLRAGFYPLNVDGVNNDPPGCSLGCFQLHGLGYCPAFKKMKVKQ